MTNVLLPKPVTDLPLCMKRNLTPPVALQVRVTEESCRMYSWFIEVGPVDVELMATSVGITPVGVVDWSPEEMDTLKYVI